MDGWVLFHAALWVAGLAVVLSALSVASYQASVERVRLREVLGRIECQRALSLGLALTCLGLLSGAHVWWGRVLWGLLCVLFATLLGWLWWRTRARPDRPVAQRPTAAVGGPLAGQRARRLGRALVLAGLVVLLAWAAAAGVRVIRAARSLEVRMRSLERLAQGGSGGLDTESLTAVGEQLAGARQDLTVIQGSIGPLLPLGRILRYVPGHGGDLVAASDLLDLALGMASAGDRIYRSLAPVLMPQIEPSLSWGEQFLAAATVAQPELWMARDELAAAEQARARIDAGRLSPQVAALLARLDGILPWLETAADGLLLAPQMLGADGPRTYLILAQNNHELRPTGGFLSGVGELTLDGGRVSSLIFGDSYAVDNWTVPHDLAPPDLQATLDGELMLFRDANWEADFPTSARRALEIYARDRGVDAEGVIALDLTALVSLVEALGPLEVEGIDEPVTGQNVVQVIQASWERPPDGSNLPGTEWFQHRKDSFGAIATAAMDRLLAGRDVDPVRLAQAVQQVLAEKHFLIYLEEPQAAELLGRMNWDGALPEPSGTCDFLLVADSNVGFNKMDANVERSIAYQVDLGQGSRPRVRLTLNYRNRSQRPLLSCVQEARYGQDYADMMERCYWDYVRVYVPAGSQLLKGPDLTLPPDSLLAGQAGGAADWKPGDEITEGEWKAWTAFFDLAPGDERTLTFEYRLPKSVLQRKQEPLTYCLHVQKQPGTEAVPFCLEVAPPADRRLVEWTPAELTLPGPTCTDLRTDREFEMVYRTTGEP